MGAMHLVPGKWGLGCAGYKSDDAGSISALTVGNEARGAGVHRGRRIGFGRQRLALTALAAVVIVALAAVALLVVVHGETPGAPVESVLTVADLHAIALEAGVPDQAVIPLGDDTAVAARWRSGQVELVRAKYARVWQIRVLGSVAALRPPGSNSAVVANLTCIDPSFINGPAFIYGSLIENGETSLRIHTPYLTDDAVLNDGTYLFVIPAEPGEAFWIDGPNDQGAPSPWPTAAGVSEPAHPGAYFVGTVAPPVTCLGFGGSIPLRTLATDNGGCRGVGLDATLAGAADDPRVAWLVAAGGGQADIIWPPGFTARFDPELEILNQSGAVVYKAGDKITSGCAAPADSRGQVLVIREGY
jgi:hypothetical protein